MKSEKKIFYQAVFLSLLSFMFLVQGTEAQDFRIRGRLHMDVFYGINDADAFSSGFNNRRARLGGGGTVADKWDGRIEVDFADGGVSPNDFRLRRSFENGGRLWIGQFKVPQGLNELTSSNEMSFIERSTPTNVIADARRMGIAYELFGSTVGFKSMVFGRALGQRGQLVDDMPLGIAFRGVFAPELGGGTLHAGASVVYENLMDNNTVRFRDRPEARDSKGGSLRLIDATVSEASSTLKAGFELLYINGPWSIEGEYLQVTVNRDNGDNGLNGVNGNNGDNPTFSGFHIQTGYVLTGESRPYSKGSVGTISPSGEKGAWELLVRYSYMDLNDAGFTGGEQSNITVGLNHYITSRLRFMFNLVIVDVDYLEDLSPVLGVLRAQYNF